METLNQRLESLQDAILNLYEKNSKKLSDQIDHWQLVRKEQVLLHYLRKQGVYKAGIIPVPALASSQTKAKQAIEMQLILSSLAESAYADEEWTLLDTSLERFKAPPQNILKKNGMTVDVRFDGDNNNRVRHTKWRDLYYQNVNNRWIKTTSHVDHKGIYYVDEYDVKIYYQDFEADADRYSSTGHWDVLINGKLIMPSVSSSSSGSSDKWGPEVPLGRREPESTSATIDTTTSQTPRHTSPSTETIPPTSSKKRRQYGRRRSRSPRKRARSSSGDRGRGGGRRLNGGETTSKSLSAPTPGEVGGSRRSVPTGAGGRLQRLLQEARDPPALVLKGDPNKLKCMRFRLKEKYSAYFSRVSTTWYWTECENTDRIGDARVLIQFTDESQRNKFLSRVKLPNSIRLTAASFYGM